MLTLPIVACLQEECRPNVHAEAIEHIEDMYEALQQIEACALLPQVINLARAAIARVEGRA
jgi:hypothetical protein